MKSSRLKNFCEVCRKQCRDQNGYLCHLNSVAHKRRLEEYTTNPQEHIQRYSSQLEHKFVQILKRKYPGETKNLQEMYQEYTQEKRVVKFNQTKWKNLAEFGEHLKSVRNIRITGGSLPDCLITYTVNKTIDFIQKNKKEQLYALKQKQKQIFEKSLINKIQRQKAHEERQTKKFDEEMRKVQKQRQSIILPDKLEFNFQNFTENNKRHALIMIQDLQRQVSQLNQNEYVSKRLVNNQMLLSKIIHKEQRKLANQSKMQKNQNFDDQPEWILLNIIVKIKPHQIDEVFYNKKSKIISIVEPYVAKVQVGTATLQIDQAFLQTVIPKIGNQVMILQGSQKGKKGILRQVDLIAGFGKIDLGEILKVPFNYFSKFQSE